MYPATSVPDLAGVDQTLSAMESQIQSIKERLQEERNAIPKAKVSSFLYLEPYILYLAFFFQLFIIVNVIIK